MRGTTYSVYSTYPTMELMAALTSAEEPIQKATHKDGARGSSYRI
jgi:hypothetical protein